MSEKDINFFESIGVKLYEDDGNYSRYNDFCCTEAIMIAHVLQTEEKIREFSKADWDTQKSIVRYISDDHSGNTFTNACRLAIAYLPMIRNDKIEEIIKN